MPVLSLIPCQDYTYEYDFLYLIQYVFNLATKYIYNFICAYFLLIDTEVDHSSNKINVSLFAIVPESYKYVYTTL